MRFPKCDNPQEPTINLKDKNYNNKKTPTQNKRHKKNIKYKKIRQKNVMTDGETVGQIDIHFVFLF